MTYAETLDYLYSKLPAFTLIGKAAYKADLDNILALSEQLGKPHTKFRSIHIAGTNGKGSTAHFLASIFQAAGYKTGLFTSPHLKDFRERFKVNGKMISRKKVIAFTKKNAIHFEAIKPSFFEMTVALAFEHFAEEKVDIAIIETGLGGRLDSTNIIVPELSLITNIGFDHMDLLGDTLEKIAAEKAGIIKRNVPVILSERKGTAHVFEMKAKHEKSPIFFAEELVEWEKCVQIHSQSGVWLECRAKWDDTFIDLKSSLAGTYQENNLRGVLAAVKVLKTKGWKIPDEALKDGIMNVKLRTGICGRWEQLQQNPSIFADTGHNIDGIKEVLQQIATSPHKQLHWVLGMVSDKDISSMLQLLPTDAQYYFCKANLFRALDASLLREHASKYNLKGRAYSSVKNALKAAKRKAAADDLIVVGGSTFVVAEIV